MSASMIAAALGDISRDLNTSASTAQIIMSTYFLGLGLGPFLVSALAEMYGRKPVWILGNVWYIIWNACSPVGKSTGVMIFGRLMTGAGASVGITVCVEVVWL
jgi:MFS family permease